MIDGIFFHQLVGLKELNPKVSFAVFKASRTLSNTGTLFRNLVSKSFLLSAVAFCTLLSSQFYILHKIEYDDAFVFSFAMKYIIEYFRL